ncbi:hypothetical protein [Microvirga soli]|uniref:hypothetical protein n=1 Tax=Microvirga soli TaxID=1854496 RepID=UPI00191FEE0B|nr:hypothetical protein [Microvirga soli]
MASSVPSFVNFRSFGSSGHLTRYDDGSFLTVWTEFSATGAAYVYGKAFKADGTTLRETFLIDAASEQAQASYSDVTVATLSDGRTVVAWGKSDSSGRSIIGKVLSSEFTASSELLSLGESSVTSQEMPQIHALQNGGFSVLYSGIESSEQAQLATITTERNGKWESDHYRLDGDGLDPRGSITLETGKFVSLFSYNDVGNTYIEADIITLPNNVVTISIDTIQGVNGEISVTASCDF